MIWLLIAQLVMWEKVVPPVLHQGSWQSCDGAERVLEHWAPVKGEMKFRWELHLSDGEFALYDSYYNLPDHTHDTKENLLGPAYRLDDVQTWRGKRNWNIPRLHLWLSIVRAGGSRDECNSFYIRVEDTTGRTVRSKVDTRRKR